MAVSRFDDLAQDVEHMNTIDVELSFSPHCFHLARGTVVKVDAKFPVGGQRPWL